MELAKRVALLQWLRHHSNTACCMYIAVGIQSMKSRLLGQKLSFLQHILKDGSEKCKWEGPE